MTNYASIIFECGVCRDQYEVGSCKVPMECDCGNRQDWKVEHAVPKEEVEK